MYLGDWLSQGVSQYLREILGGKYSRLWKLDCYGGLKGVENYFVPAFIGIKGTIGLLSLFCKFKKNKDTWNRQVATPLSEMFLK